MGRRARSSAMRRRILELRCLLWTRGKPKSKIVGSLWALWRASDCADHCKYLINKGGGGRGPVAPPVFKTCSVGYGGAIEIQTNEKRGGSVQSWVSRGLST